MRKSYEMDMTRGPLLRSILLFMLPLLLSGVLQLLFNATDIVVVGQFADAQDGENYGIVLPKGSKLTPTVSAAVDRLAESGKLAELQEKWLNEAQNVPILK